MAGSPGSFQSRLMLRSPGSEVRPLGAAGGGESGVAEISLAAPAPAAFRARTWIR